MAKTRTHYSLCKGVQRCWNIYRIYTKSRTLSNLGCSISRFSNGDISMMIGPVDVKHGGGVTNQDSSIELGRIEFGKRLSKPSRVPAPAELLRLCRPRLCNTTGAFLISTKGISSSESVCGGLSAIETWEIQKNFIIFFAYQIYQFPNIPSLSTINQSDSSSSHDLTVTFLCGFGNTSTVGSSRCCWIFCWSTLFSVSLVVEFPRKYDANDWNIICNGKFKFFSFALCFRFTNWEYWSLVVFLWCSARSNKKKKLYLLKDACSSQMWVISLMFSNL